MPLVALCLASAGVVGSVGVAAPASAAPGAARYGSVAPGAARYGLVPPGAARYGPIAPGAARYALVPPGAARYGPIAPGAVRYGPSAARLRAPVVGPNTVVAPRARAGAFRRTTWRPGAPVFGPPAVVTPRGRLGALRRATWRAAAGHHPAVSRATGRRTPGPATAPARLTVAAPVVTLPTRAIPGHVRAGVLIADRRHLATDWHAGVRVAVLELKWSSWAPSASGADEAYRAERVATAVAYRAAGFEVAVDPGLQHAPSWVLNQPDGQLRAQDGSGSGTADYVFNPVVRSQAAAYLRALTAALGPVASYRVGLSGSGEATYPEAGGNQWWAFDRYAQGGRAGVASGHANPLPGWVPGSSYHDASVTAAQVGQWYAWYLGASVDALAWEMRTLRDSGFSGALQLVMPGNGANTWVVTHRLADGLADRSYDGFHTLNTGAVWDRVLSLLPDLTGVTVDVSSVYDHSGDVRGNGCTSADDAVSWSTPGAMDGWSSTRVLAYLARRHHLPLVGENPGASSGEDLRHVFHLAASCGLGTVYWAWDYQLYDGQHATPADLAEGLRIS